MSYLYLIKNEQYDNFNSFYWKFCADGVLVDNSLKDRSPQVNLLTLHVRRNYKLNVKFPINSKHETNWTGFRGPSCENIKISLYIM